MTKFSVIPSLSAMQGKSEQRSETYMQYGERAAELLTQQGAKSIGRVRGSAAKSANTARDY
ncbi:MAG TPA: hypothetical protein VLG37_02300 [Candidatus Saccharimonadales bacterium]|nr:hypothetical protein [Candidatus Saccharimonadales bacterium]